MFDTLGERDKNSHSVTNETPLDSVMSVRAHTDVAANEESYRPHSMAKSYQDSMVFFQRHKCVNANVNIFAKFKYKCLFRGILGQVSNLVQASEPL